jgi:hypothetical protein
MANRPSHIFLTSHNTAIVPFLGSQEYLRRVDTWFESIERQEKLPVLVELDRNLPVVSALQSCETLSHGTDAVMPHEDLLKNLLTLSTKCQLIVLFDFKKASNPTKKTTSCQDYWRKLFDTTEISYQERTSVKKPGECEEGKVCNFFSLDTKKNAECLKLSDVLKDEHRKTYNAGGQPRLSPLFAVMNCYSDCLAHDAWNLTDVRDCIIRGLHTTSTSGLSSQPTDFARVRMHVHTEPATSIAVMRFGDEGPEPFVTVADNGMLEFATAKSFAVVAVKQGSRWRTFRIFAQKAVEEPISSNVYKSGGYSAPTVTQKEDVTHVDFEEREAAVLTEANRSPGLFNRRSTSS